MKLRLGLLALALACGGPPRVEEKILTSIHGRVLDRSDQQPIANALIQTEPFVKQVFTNAMGQFSIEESLIVGTAYRVTASKDGYENNSITTAAIVEGTNTVADLLLAKRAPKLNVEPASVQIGVGSTRGLFVVGNSGDKTQGLMFTATGGEAWIREVTPSSGTVTSIDQTITVHIDRTMLPMGAGEVSGTVVVSSNGGSATVAIRVLR